jgi:hypothetical protein
LAIVRPEVQEVGFPHLKPLWHGLATTPIGALSRRKTIDSKKLFKNDFLKLVVVGDIESFSLSTIFKFAFFSIRGPGQDLTRP